jgi:cyclophilin family peptidyl-prolyl cis-trans isomerase
MLFLSALVAGCIAVAGCGSSTPPEEPPAETPEAEAPAETMPPEAEVPPTEEPAPAPTEPETKPQSKAEPPKGPVGPPIVAMETSMGTMRVELYPDKAPATVENFLKYADSGFYDGTIFHRVIKNFMIQGGGFTPDMNQKETRAPIKNEAGKLANLRGTLAMARTPDPHSASSQFFINHATNQSLDKERYPDGWGYCVFGKVVEGIEVVDKIAEVKTGSKAGHQDVPIEPVLIKSVRRVS